MYHKRGFTLIELLVVVLIIGILSAIALPQYQVAVAKSRYASGMHMVDSVWKAQQVYYMANGQYATQFEDLDISLPAGMRHVSVPGDTGDDRWENEDFRFNIRVDSGQGNYVYVVIKHTNVSVKPEYLRYFRQPGAKCYAWAPSALWNKVCLSFNGKLSSANGFWNIYDLP